MYVTLVVEPRPQTFDLTFQICEIATVVHEEIGSVSPLPARRLSIYSPAHILQVQAPVEKTLQPAPCWRINHHSHPTIAQEIGDQRHFHHNDTLTARLDIPANPGANGRMGQRFEQPKPGRIGEHIPGEETAIDGTVNQRVRKRGGDPLERLTSRFEHLVSDLISVDDAAASPKQHPSDLTLAGSDPSGQQNMLSFHRGSTVA